MDFLPTCRQELDERGWDACDVVLVSGDAYVDSPFHGVALLGRLLEADGLRVGILPQPDPRDPEAIRALGEPRLFWGVSGGSVDSMVANHTASGRRRRRDDLTPGGVNDRRPDRAVIVYTNRIRAAYRDTAPIVLGGIEASLRRITHYDFWSHRLRRSVLFDAKADLLVYGMGERTVRELAGALTRGEDPLGIRGLCYPGQEVPAGYLELPSHQQVVADDRAFEEMFRTFHRHSDPLTASGLAQRQDTRWLVQNPPALRLEQAELDRLHELGFTHRAHPREAARGEVRALDTIRFSLISQRGCYGDCRFCAITVHQGRTVTWRSEESLLREARRLTEHPDFKGVITDVGGPTANMYGFECEKKLREGACPETGCLFPQRCRRLVPDHSRQIHLLRRLRGIPGVRRVFLASGIRHDLVAEDREHGAGYVEELARHHVSGQLKLAPEHTEEAVLHLMGKPGTLGLRDFHRRFREASRRQGKEQYLTYYVLAAHPGCTAEDMRRARDFFARELGATTEQVQLFTPTPSTWSSVMYWTGRDPVTGAGIHVERRAAAREEQKRIMLGGRRRGTTRARDRTRGRADRGGPEGGEGSRRRRRTRRSRPRRPR